MGKNIKILEGFNEMTEEFGCALGDAEDFLDRVGTMTLDLIDDVVAGRIGAAEAKRRINVEYMGARADLVIWRAKRLADAYEYKYKHILDNSVDSTPWIRIVVPTSGDSIA